MVWGPRPAVVSAAGDAETVQRVGWGGVLDGCEVRGGVADDGPAATGSRRLPALFGVPAAPADFFEVDVAVEAAGFAAAAAAFEGADYEATGFGRGDAAETGDGGGEVSHYVADGEGAVGQKDGGEVVFGEEGGGDGAGGVEAGEVVRVVMQGEAALGLVLGFGVVDRVLEIYIRVDVGGSGGGSGRCGGGVAFVVVEGLGWEGRGDGIGGRG